MRVARPFLIHLSISLVAYCFAAGDEPIRSALRQTASEASGRTIETSSMMDPFNHQSTPRLLVELWRSLKLLPLVRVVAIDDKRDLFASGEVHELSGAGARARFV
jgi:hypothetical protein